MIAATVRSARELYNIKNNCSIYGQTPESIYKVYSDVLKPLNEEMIQKFEQKGIRMNHNFSDEESFRFFIEQLVEYAYDGKKAEEAFRNCAEYFRNEVGKQDIAFDLGYSGKLQSAICKAIGFPVDVFFLHTNGFDAEQQARQNGYQIKSFYNFSTSMSGIVNEFIFSDYGPSCVGYSRENGIVEPIFEKRVVPYQEKFILDEIAWGCEKFINDFYETFQDYLYLFEYRIMDTSLPYERFLMNPKWFDINLLKHCYLEDEYYGGISEKRLSDHWWWQMNNKHILMQQGQGISVSYMGARPELQNLYQDGLFVALYQKINKVLPLGSKRREFVKKVAGKVMK